MRLDIVLRAGPSQGFSPFARGSRMEREAGPPPLQALWGCERQRCFCPAGLYKVLAGHTPAHLPQLCPSSATFLVLDMRGEVLPSYT